MMTEKEKDEYIKQLESEVGKWHRAFDALMVERNHLVLKCLQLENDLKESKNVRKN